MTLNIKNFVKYIICLGVVYGALKISKCELDKKTTLIILTSIVVVLILSDTFFKTEGMASIWDQVGQLDDIDLSFDFKDSESEGKIDKLIKESSEEIEEELELIKVSETESESNAKVSAGTVITTKGKASVTPLGESSKPSVVSKAKSI